MNSRLMSLLLVLVLVVSLLPVYSAAADTGKVRVIVENTTARDPEYQGTVVPWRDQLFDIFVDYTDGMSMMRAQIVTFLWRDLERTSDPLAAAMAAVEENNGKPVCGQSDWAVFDAFRNAAVSATALPAAYYEYYATVENKAKQTEGKMDAKYATDNARYVLTVTALGYDATDVAGYDLTAPLQGLDYVRKQGVNGVIYTLLALDSANY